MSEVNVHDDRTIIKYKKRMERELTRLKIENNVAVMLRDMERGISELLERERQRNLTATYTNVIMENSSDRFILLDEHLRLLLCSHNFETEGMSSARPGIELEALLDILPNEGNTPEAVAEMRAALESIVITGESLKHSLSLGHGDETRYFVMTAKGVNDSSSGQKGVVLTLTESTALTRAMQEVQSADKAKTAFLANMSHEIRTPINAIVGISEIALERGGLSDEMQSDLSVIQNSATGLLSIINDILDFSKIESGKFQIVETEYTLPSLLMDICNMIGVKLLNSPVRLMMSVDSSLPFNLYGDDIRVKQILINLLNNATKFTKTGFIELCVSGEYLAEDRVKLVFKVIDTGIGIKKEDIGKLFGTFSQVDTQRNRAINGSGLGLAISRNLAEAMGGGITVESEYGSGSTFIVTIIQEVRGTKPIGSVKRNDKVRMLVVEDDEVLIDNIGRTLKDLGIEYQICRSSDSVRTFKDFTHVMILRKNFPAYRERLEFMFESKNIYLILDQGEISSTDYIAYKQLVLPLLSLQIINALNDDEIISSMKKVGFKRSQIVPLTFAKVLIVDDNATNLQVAKGLMAPYKMHIDTASSGYKAIELVRKNNYDAIFMDHMMPEMDGVETTQFIRNLDGEYFKTVPVIALTANAMSDAREMFLTSGMDDFISKPIEIVELNRVIKKFIETKAPEGYLESYKKSKEQEQAASKKESASKVAETIPVTNVNGGLLEGLLQQNNMLLSQNSLLLQHLLGAVSAQSNTGVSAPAITPVVQPDAAITAGSSTKTENELKLALETGNELESATKQNLMDNMKDSDEADSIPGVNMEEAIEGCGGLKEVYDEILKTYYTDLTEREPELQQMYDSHDIKNFTIIVHALKSASRSVGATDLGEAAYSLEMHGKAEEWDDIEKEYPAFLASLHNMAEQVGQYLSKHFPAEKNVSDDEEKEILPGFSSDVLKRLQAAIADMDYMLVEDILHEMNEFCYPEPEMEVLSSMLKACGDFEYDQLETLAAGLTPVGE